MPCKAPDAWTLDAELWLARLGRQSPADGAAQWLTDAPVAQSGGARACVLSARAAAQVTALTAYRVKQIRKEFSFFLFNLSVETVKPLIGLRISLR